MEFIVVATLTVRDGTLDAFRAYELQAAAILARYAGVIERTVVIPASPDAPLREVHVIRFPDRAAFDRYRSDEELISLRPMREACVAATAVLCGEPGPDYQRAES